MVRIVVRLVGVLLALAGLALTVVGVWFATRLGGDGTAEFTTRPQAGRPVLLTPQVLNRVDADVTVTATPSAGGRVWMALANPSDATAVLGRAERAEVTGVDVRDWALLTRSTGSGEAKGLTGAELWRQQDDAEGPVSLTVDQASAPESVVVAAEQGDIASVTMRVSDKRWFVESVVATLVGLFLLVGGVLAAWPRRRRPGADGGTPLHPDPTPASTVDPETENRPAPRTDSQEVGR